MNITNIKSTTELESLAKVKKSSFEETIVANRDISQYENEGWSILKRGPNRSRLRRQKNHAVMLEDRLWWLLFKMGFKFMSDEGGATVTTGGETPVRNQIDVLAIDENICIVVECKSRLEPGRRSSAQDELAKLSTIVDTTRRALATSEHGRKKVGAVYAFTNASLSDEDEERAKQAKILVLNDTAISYYEKLVEHTGTAAKFQFLADLFPGQTLSSLAKKVPAVRTRVGNQTAYIFAIEPSHLLQIAYVSHRMRGDSSSFEAYQRMVNKKRLQEIQKFIDEDGVFPTNIVVNFDQDGRNSQVQFSRARQEENESDVVTTGWLELPKKYQSAWIIDGQHRLLAFSGHPRAESSTLCVTAFDGLSFEEQANMFIEINSKQKKVSSNLLHELMASLKRNSSNVRELIGALASSVVQKLNATPESPFYNRIKSSDDNASATKCMTFTTIAKPLGDKSDFYVTRWDGKAPVEYGPLWKTNFDDCVKRSFRVINGWFEEISDVCHDIWALGSSEGGFLATNNGVAPLLKVLESVLKHLGLQECGRMSDIDLTEKIKPFARASGDFFKSLTPADLKAMRRLQGASGHGQVMRQVQQYLSTVFTDFQPDGLAVWIENQDIGRAQEAKLKVDDIERRLHKVVVGTLKDTYFDTDEAWWLHVPLAIRTDVSARREVDGRKRPLDGYFYLINYKDIVDSEWNLFSPTFNKLSSDQSKSGRTNWFVRLNEIRNKAAHPNSGGLSKDDVAWLDALDERLMLAGI
jgi:DNA sulfur modification protein DndB